MAIVTLCDWRDSKGSPCGERAETEVQLTQDGKRYVVDLCQIHQKPLVANAREAGSPAPVQRERVTVLPRAGSGRNVSAQLVDKIDYVDLRAWAEGAGILPAGSRGRIKQEIQQKWLDEGSPRPV